MPREKPKIAIATGDPAGIGPEISLKAALDPAVRAACNPILVSDVGIIERHAKACGIEAELHAVDRIGDANWSGNGITVLACPAPRSASITLGGTSAAAGRASIGFCGTAIKAALAGDVNAVAAAPQNETSIAMAGIAFDGHPSFVARKTGTDENNVFMMLSFGDTKIAHATLHQGVQQAVAAITKERVSCVINATHRALQRLGIDAPKICVSGLNPHAGEGGLFGREEIDIIKPAIDAATADGLNVTGPFGADTMFHRTGVDAYVVMLHDQGHIAAKLLARNAAAALTIGTPILFSSVAHGSAHDIAGMGIADASALIEAILQLTAARPADRKTR